MSIAGGRHIFPGDKVVHSASQDTSVRMQLAPLQMCRNRFWAGTQHSHAFQETVLPPAINLLLTSYVCRFVCLQQHHCTGPRCCHRARVQQQLLCGLQLIMWVQSSCVSMPECAVRRWNMEFDRPMHSSCRCLLVSSCVCTLIYRCGRLMPLFWTAHSVEWCSSCWRWLCAWRFCSFWFRLQTFQCNTSEQLVTKSASSDLSHLTSWELSCWEASPYHKKSIRDEWWRSSHFGSHTTTIKHT